MMALRDWLLLAGLLISLGAAAYFWHRARVARAEAHAAGAARAEANAARAAAEQKALTDAGHLAALGEASLDALLLVDAGRRILWGNQAAWEMFAAPAPAIGRSFMSLVHDYELNQAIVDAILGGRAIVRQTVIGSRTLRIRAVPVAGEGGAAVAIEDVTELQRLGRARRDFVANLSHELRTPLANIALAAQTIQESGARDEALTARMLEQIQAQVQALSQLNQEIMDLAQIESGQVLLKLVPAPIAPLVEKTLATMLPQAKRKAQQITLSLPEDLEALIDEQQ
ncbi:MAG: histidine kinase dimerization/phospho-acceptor domain-containing protein, partial [Anaerolineae bacterium]